MPAWTQDVEDAEAARTRCTQCNRHWREALQTGPQGRHWALQCQPKAGTGWHWGTGVPAEGWHWPELGIQCQLLRRHWALQRQQEAAKSDKKCPCALFLLKIALKSTLAPFLELIR